MTPEEIEQASAQKTTGSTSRSSPVRNERSKPTVDATASRQMTNDAKPSGAMPQRSGDAGAIAPDQTKALKQVERLTGTIVELQAHDRLGSYGVLKVDDKSFYVFQAGEFYRNGSHIELGAAYTFDVEEVSPRYAKRIDKVLKAKLYG